MHVCKLVRALQVTIMTNESLQELISLDNMEVVRMSHV